MDNIIKKDEYTLPFVSSASLEKSREPCPICGYTPSVIKGEQNDKI